MSVCWSRTERHASARSLTPAAVRCAPATIAAVTAAMDRWRRRIRSRCRESLLPSARASATCIGSTVPSTLTASRSARRPSVMARKTIKVNALARVEGEGALTVVIRDNQVKSAALRIFEPPRFFEAFMRGRAYSEAPDITARICGICPVAYQMSAVHAIEDAIGVTVGGQLRELRRLLYCGEWIESHTLHIYMLHAPDFLGYEGAVDMARDHGDVVKRGLELKKIGNEIVTTLGGREIHPINVKVGGFYRAPRRREFDALAERLKWARDAALETVRWVG